MTDDYERTVKRTEADLRLRCAYCGKAAQGQYSIHRDGFSEGPEVELCNTCGGKETPTASEIWDKISHTRNKCLVDGHFWIGDVCFHCDISKEELWGPP